MLMVGRLGGGGGVTFMYFVSAAGRKDCGELAIFSSRSLLIFVLFGFVISTAV